MLGVALPESACSPERPEPTGVTRQDVAIGAKLTLHFTELRVGSVSELTGLVKADVPDGNGDRTEIPLVDCSDDPRCIPGGVIALDALESHVASVAVEEGENYGVGIALLVENQAGLDIQQGAPITVGLDGQLLTPTCLEIPDSGGWGLCWEVTFERSNLSPQTRSMPTTVVAANAELNRRRRDLVDTWVQRYKNAGHTLPVWDDKSQEALAMLAAGAAVFGRPDIWADAPADATRLAADLGGLENWREDVEARLLIESPLEPKAFIHQHKDIGTDHADKDCNTPATGKPQCGDYDFTLVDSIRMIYAFRERSDVISNALVRQLLTHGKVTFTEGPNGCTTENHLPFSGQDPDDELTVGANGHDYIVEEGRSRGYDFIIKIATSETENHVLAMYAWRYLAQNYLEWVARGNAGARTDPCLQALFDSDVARYTNSPELTDFLVKISARFLHHGAFETNAKPYASITVPVLMTLADHADDLFADSGRRRVGVAAQNGLDFLAGEFAFQSFEGKRVAPMRRQTLHKDNVHPHQNDSLPNIFGVLSGAYVFDDRITLATGEVCENCKSRPYLPQNLDPAAQRALWAGLSGYRIPVSIHDFMLNKNPGYWARMQSRYTRAHYDFNFNANADSQGSHVSEPDTPLRAPSEYEPVTTTGFGTYKPVTQYYFASNGFLNSAGGSYGRFFPRKVCVTEDDLEDQEALDDLGALIGGTVCWIGSGEPLVGLACAVALGEILGDEICKDHELLRDYDAYAKPHTVLFKGPLFPVNNAWPSLARETLLMPGHSEVSNGENLVTYKSFSYGYREFPGTELLSPWPQVFPTSWEPFRAGADLSVGDITFRLFDFTSAPQGHPAAGHYMVFGHLPPGIVVDGFVPSAAAKGFWEIVPAARFPGGVQQLRSWVSFNPSTVCGLGFSCGPAYRMTTGETVVLDDENQADKVEILGILAADGSEIDEFLYRIPDGPAGFGYPLMTVWEVDERHDFTGRVLAQALGNGAATFSNCEVGERLLLDSSDITNPTRTTLSIPRCETTCDPQAPFDAPVAAFTGSMDADGLTFSADGQRAYISGAGPGGRDIYVATRNSDGTFSAPELVTAVSTDLMERTPALAPDGRLYFTKQATSGWLDIGQATGTPPNFIDAEAVGDPVSSDKQDEDPFWWGNDTLYFVSERPLGDHRDVWVSTPTGTSKIPGPVNSTAEEFHPVVSPDGLTMYFSSRRSGIGNDTSGDIFMARRTPTNPEFSNVVNLWGMNTTGIDYPVTISANGCTLYFASNEETGLSNSPNFRLYQATRGASTPAQVTLRLNILGTGSVTQPPFNCGPRNTGTCSASAPPDTTMLVNASSPAQWTGSCAGNGGVPSTDGVLAFSENAVCTIKFPGAPLVGAGGLCSLSMDCQQGLQCVNNTCG
jgi:hypothetical protein